MSCCAYLCCQALLLAMGSVYMVWRLCKGNCSLSSHPRYTCCVVSTSISIVPSHIVQVVMMTMTMTWMRMTLTCYLTTPTTYP